jgi:SAM-dependent methyltransferase
MSSPIEENLLEKYALIGTGANIGCGPRQIGNSIGVDIKPNAAAAIITADARVLPFRSDSLDYIVSAHCIEHIQDSPLLVLREWIRCLKVGGKLTLVTPYAGASTGSSVKALESRSFPGKFNPSEHCQLFTSQTLFAYMKQAGLEAVSTSVHDRSDYWKNFDIILGTGTKSKAFSEKPQKLSKLLWMYRTAKSANIANQILFRLLGNIGPNE